MPNHYDIIIVGASHAGAQAAINLRQMGFNGSLALISGEKYPPYERPPLSKEFLAGDKPFERILLRPEGFWAERDINLITGTRVVRISPIDKMVALSNGEQMHYDKIIWAGGGSPRQLDCPGAHARNLFSVRTRRDVDMMGEFLPTAKHIAIIGGGYIGLEAAAVMRKMRKEITIIEAESRVLSRVAGISLSEFYQQYHHSQGVTIRTDTGVERILTDKEGIASSIICDRGEPVVCDMAIAGIGIVPDVGPLVAEGAAAGNGVDVDEYCRTSLPDIYAIGDCAAHANIHAEGRRIRLESVQNANDQARVAVNHIMDNPGPYDAIPWFWSNQYELKLQTVGLLHGYDQEIVRGDPKSLSFSVCYLRAGRLIALDCVNKTKDYVQGRKRILEGRPLDLAQLSDNAIALKEVELA